MYKLEILKDKNIIRITINKDNMTEEFKTELDDNNICSTGNCIHFRMSNKSNVLNTMDKIPRTLEIISKHIKLSIA